MSTSRDVPGILQLEPAQALDAPRTRTYVKPVQNGAQSGSLLCGLMLCLLADTTEPQSKKRGLSLEEKKAAVLSIFHETKDVFTLKVLPRAVTALGWSSEQDAGMFPGSTQDAVHLVTSSLTRPACTPCRLSFATTAQDVEKLAPKKGVIVQSVKEVLQALVDDSVLHQDKIGISNFFWSFPSEAAVKVRTLQVPHARHRQDKYCREMCWLCAARSCATTRSACRSS